MLPAGTTLRHCSPNHGFMDFQELYQSNHGTAGNHEAGGFVNSAVTDIQESHWIKYVSKHAFKIQSDGSELMSRETIPRVIRGGSRISQKGGCESMSFNQNCIFAENWMKMNKMGPRLGARTPGAPLDQRLVSQ